MSLPWWGWLLVALWCSPGVYAAFALLLQKPGGGLDEHGKPYRPPPFSRKLVAFPLALIVLVIVWPGILWSEFRHSRS